MTHASSGLALVVALLLGGAANAKEVLVVKLRPDAPGVSGVEQAECKELGSRIEKRRCEDTQRKMEAVYRTQGDLGDILQDDVANGSALNRIQSN